MHLTNYSVQKNHHTNRCKDASDLEHFEENGSKMTLTKLRSKLKHMRVSYGSPGADETKYGIRSSCWC